MKQVCIIIFCFLFALSTSAQSVKKIDRATKNRMRKAERYIPDFHRKDVVKYYSVCRLLTKKKYRNMKFDSIPSYVDIDQFLDFNHTPVDEVLAKTNDRIWLLVDKYSNHKSFLYRSSKQDELYSYLDSIHADRVYNLFDQCYLVEKSGVRYPIKFVDGVYRKCDLKDHFDDIFYFNLMIFPYDEKQFLYYVR
jgi:hypothetical protein